MDTKANPIEGEFTDPELTDPMDDAHKERLDRSQRSAKARALFPWLAPKAEEG